MASTELRDQLPRHPQCRPRARKSGLSGGQPRSLLLRQGA